MYNKIDDEHIFYKSSRIISGKLRLVLVDEYGNIVDNNPTKEQIELAIPDWKKDKYKGSKCCICGSINTYITPNGYEEWYSHKCNKKYCTRYLCKNCWLKGYNKNNRYCRTGNLDPESNRGKGFIIEMVVAKVRNLKNCGLELDNFNAKFDLSIDSEYGKPQVKGPTLITGKWHANIGIEHNFDHIWIICMSEDRRHVERVYIVPKSKLYAVTVDIYEDWSKVRGMSKFEWIEEYRVDEKPYDDAYHSLKLENCKVLRKPV